jgi:hypothetical protein
MTAPLKWKIKDDEGHFYVYNRGDIIFKNGKTYIATRTTNVEDGSPEHGIKAGWKSYTSNRIKEYTEGTSTPLDPLVGDEWYDTSIGILFKYIDDETSTQWVEI